MNQFVNFFENSIYLSGNWEIINLSKILDELKSHELKQDINVIDGSGICALDTAGAKQLIILLSQLKTAKLLGVSKKQLELIGMIKKLNLSSTKISKEETIDPVSKLGQIIQQKIVSLIFFCRFVFKVTKNIPVMLKNYAKFPLTEVVAVIESAGMYAIPIISLLSFLIGVVICYQISMQLSAFGANLYVAQITGVIILREFGPLIAAVIIAGRTASSFTALIGSMKINEELDALDTMGLSTYNRIIIPRLFALLIVMPILTLIANIAGLIGSMITAFIALGVEPVQFLNRLQEYVAVKHLFVGLIKSPVFAGVIVLVGCYQGLVASKSTIGVSNNTTKSVVQALFLIIIIDAVFSIIFAKV